MSYLLDFFFFTSYNKNFRDQDFLDMEFHFIAKEGEDTLIDYAGTINSQYFGEDIFHCFNSDNLWICPKPGYEENFPWMED